MSCNDKLQHYTYVCTSHLYIVRSDYSLASVGKVVFTAGGPDEQTIQLSVDEDDFLELNETYLLELNLTVASIAAGARIGAINQARVTIINDDSKICNICTLIMLYVFYKHFQEYRFFFSIN